MVYTDVAENLGGIVFVKLGFVVFPDINVVLSDA